VSFFATIHEEAAKRNLRLLLIGGHAINYYGCSRETSDLDFLISQKERAGWMQIFAQFGYNTFHDRDCFIQYDAPHDSAWPVDLMLVQEQTFGAMLSQSVEADFFDNKTRVPSLEHLIALKLHALKHTQMHRFLKDFLDVENLIYINKLDIKSPHIRNLFEKYGTPDLYEKISRSVSH
jgi:hypothetical protein